MNIEASNITRHPIEDKVAAISTSIDAIALADTSWWVGVPARSVALAQLRQDLLCMPAKEFHRAVEAAAGRSVWTHELAEPAHLVAEILGTESAPDGPLSSLNRVLAGKAHAVLPVIV